MTPERKKKVWNEVIRIVVNAIIAITAAVTATSCMQVNKHSDESPKSIPMYVQPSKTQSYGE